MPCRDPHWPRQQPLVTSTARSAPGPSSFFMIQRCFRSLFTRRFVHSSPSTQPGFLTFSFVEELKAQQRHHRLHEQPDSAASSDSRLLQGLGTISAPLKTEPPSIPGTLSQMLRPLFTPHSYQPRLSGLMSVSELSTAAKAPPSSSLSPRASHHFLSESKRVEHVRVAATASHGKHSR